MSNVERHAYRSAKAELVDVLARTDPMRLVSMGMPDDEYEPEAGDLLRIKSASAIDVQAVLVRWFEEPVDHATAELLATEIRTIRSRHGLA